MWTEGRAESQGRGGAGQGAGGDPGGGAPSAGLQQYGFEEIEAEAEACFNFEACFEKDAQEAVEQDRGWDAKKKKHKKKKKPDEVKSEDNIFEQRGNQAMLKKVPGFPKLEE